MERDSRPINSVEKNRKLKYPAFLNVYHYSDKKNDTTEKYQIELTISKYINCLIDLQVKIMKLRASKFCIFNLRIALN